MHFEEQDLRRLGWGRVSDSFILVGEFMSAIGAGGREGIGAGIGIASVQERVANIPTVHIANHVDFRLGLCNLLLRGDLWAAAHAEERHLVWCARGACVGVTVCGLCEAIGRWWCCGCELVARRR
jgi:hypothetical protein